MEDKSPLTRPFNQPSRQSQVAGKSEVIYARNIRRQIKCMAEDPKTVSRKNCPEYWCRTNFPRQEKDVGGGWLDAPFPNSVFYWSHRTWTPPTIKVQERDIDFFLPHLLLFFYEAAFNLWPCSYFTTHIDWLGKFTRRLTSPSYPLIRPIYWLGVKYLLKVISTVRRRLLANS